MLSSNGIVLNYAIVMYDKSKSKVKIVQEIVDELLVTPYFLCDSIGTLLSKYWSIENESDTLPL